jgi:integrase
MLLRGKAYHACFQVNGRRVRKKLANDFRVACDLLAELKARAARADFGIRDNEVAIEELKTLWLRHCEQSCRSSTVKRYRENLASILPKISAVRVAQIRAESILRFRNDRLFEVGPRTVNMSVNALSTMLRWGVDQGLIESNPIANVKPLRNDDPKKKRRSLTGEEVEAIFKHSPGYLQPALRMLGTTGMRRGELIGMKFQDIDFERCTATIRASTAKNHREREIPLDADTFEMVVRLRAAAEHRQPVAGKTKPGRLSREHVFVTGANTPWTNSGNLLRSFYVICKRAGIAGAEPNGSVDLHSLRVSFTTLAMDGGANPKAIQSILGHSSLEMTMGVYARGTDESKRDAIEALPFASTTESRDVIPMERRA